MNKNIEPVTHLHNCEPTSESVDETLNYRDQVQVEPGIDALNEFVRDIESGINPRVEIQRLIADYFQDIVKNIDHGPYNIMLQKMGEPRRVPSSEAQIDRIAGETLRAHFHLTNKVCPNLSEKKRREAADRELNLAVIKSKHPDLTLKQAMESVLNSERSDAAPDATDVDIQSAMDKRRKILSRLKNGSR